jgi:methyl-accepting chemotaxis protein
MMGGYAHPIHIKAMHNHSLNPRNWGVGGKITGFTFGLISVILSALILLISYTTSSLLEERASAGVGAELRGVSNMVEVFNTALNNEADSFARILATSFEGKFALEGGTLKNGGKTVNQDFSVPDRFSAQTGAQAAVYAASGDELVRVSSSVKKADGERDVGANLAHEDAAYAALRAGQAHAGLVTLAGKQYISRYEPLKDEAGKLVGALHVAIDVSKDLAGLKAKIRAIKLGQTGYFYVLDANPANYGTLLVHPSKEGGNLLAVKDASGREFIKDILAQKDGVTRYPWANAGETAPREKIVVFSHFKDWNWVIAGGVYTGEITTEVGQLRNRFILLGLTALVAFASALFFAVRNAVTRPLLQAQQAASQMAGGDLSVNLAVKGNDEIGRLMRGMNDIGSNLSAVVGKVRSGAEHIASASSQISVGNIDLCSRTEQQAASLEETASSMQELISTVKQNADNAQQANQLAMTASTIAARGGAVVSQVVGTMSSINESSRKIVDIIGVIDGIAFQTNILALNAAVEAARAGEQGRGFAVVATEVRGLAQRSAAAAKEIKELIGDSVGKVDAGSKLVEQAGATMDEVVASVGHVTNIMAEISAASAEQTRGIEQVNDAITEMDQATQQNAALVEEAAAATGSLHDQAESLAHVVRIFKLDRNAPAANAADAGRVLALQH